MDNATNFALDFQENPNLSTEEFKNLVNRYSGTKREDGITLDFNDGSVIRWNEIEHCWDLNPKS